MIKCAVIGASAEALPMIALAKEMGIYTIGLDGNPEAEGLAAVDEKLVIDIRDKEKVAALLKDRGISFILPVPVGFILTTAAYVNDALGLKGVGYEAALRCGDKYLFAQLLEQSGLRPTDTVLLTKQTQVEKLSYPRIIKPRCGAGSKLVTIVANPRELQEFLCQAPQDEEFILEKLLPGVEHGVDGVVVEGKVQVTLLRRKVISQPPYRQALAYSSVLRQQEVELYAAVTKYFQEVVEVLGIRNSIFHGDLMVAGQEMAVIEMAGRPSGHNINSVFLPLATKLNLVQEYIKFALGKEYTFLPKEYQLIAESFFNFEGEKILALPDQEKLQQPWLLQYDCQLQVGEKLGAITDGHSVVGRGAFIVSGGSAEELQEHITYVHQLFTTEKIK